MAKGKHPGGRPPKYDKRYHPLLIFSLRQNDLTVEQCADRMGIHKDTVYDWRDKYKEFSDSFQKGKDYQIAKTRNSLFNRANGMTVIKTKVVKDAEGVVITETTEKAELPPDTGAAAFILKNLDPANYRDKHVVETDDSSHYEKAVENLKRALGED